MQKWLCGGEFMPLHKPKVVFQRMAFIGTILTAAIVAACGRQVTPNPPGLGPGGAPPGYLAVHFDTQSPFNFSNYQYMIVFNTSGSEVTPSTQTVQTNWAGYEFALIAYGNGINTAAELVQFVHNANPKQPPTWLPLHTTPTQLNFNPNSNGAGTEFSMIAQKIIFKGIASPAPAPSSTPPNLWTFNAFVAQASNGGQWQFYDSMGAGGPNPPEFVSPVLNMDTCFDNTYYAQYVPADPAAQILTVEISNNPSPPNSCSSSS
jgi:disulfide bond formation protein DsbB